MEASSSNFLCLPEDPTELTELAPGYRGWLMHVLGRPNRSRNPVTIQYSREDDPAFLGAGAIVSGWRVSIRAPGFIFIFRGLRGADCAAPLEAIELVCRQLLELTVGGIDSTDNVNPTIYNPRKCYNPAAEYVDYPIIIIIAIVIGLKRMSRVWDTCFAFSGSAGTLNWTVAFAISRIPFALPLASRWLLSRPKSLIPVDERALTWI